VRHQLRRRASSQFREREARYHTMCVGKSFPRRGVGHSGPSTRFLSEPPMAWTSDSPQMAPFRCAGASRTENRRCLRSSYVARNHGYPPSDCASGLDALAQRLALIGERSSAPCARSGPGICAQANRMIIGDAHDPTRACPSSDPACFRRSLLSSLPGPVPGHPRLSDLARIKTWHGREWQTSIRSLHQADYYARP